MEKKDLKKKFPKLFDEIEGTPQKIEINGIRWAYEDVDELCRPDVFSFLRRCETDNEGLEIIGFLEKRNEVSSEMAEDLRQQIRSRGIRSFGKKKEWGYYEKKFKRD